jgi:hypothetical protein
MDNHLDSRDVRASRRAGIAIRLVLYPIALALIALAWRHANGGSSEANPPQRGLRVAGWVGVTSQGQPIKVVTGNGRVSFVDTELPERCSDGSVFTLHWLPFGHQFVQHGVHFRGLHIGSGRTESGAPFTFETRMRGRMGTHPDGTIQASVRLVTKHGTHICVSGDVAFALHRSG